MSDFWNELGKFIPADLELSSYSNFIKSSHASLVQKTLRSIPDFKETDIIKMCEYYSVVQNTEFNTKIFNSIQGEYNEAFTKYNVATRNSTLSGGDALNLEALQESVFHLIQMLNVVSRMKTIPFDLNNAWQNVTKD